MTYMECDKYEFSPINMKECGKERMIDTFIVIPELLSFTELRVGHPRPCQRPYQAPLRYPFVNLALRRVQK